MSPPAVGCVVFALVFGSALLAVFVHGMLPEHHLSTDSKDVVKLGIALIATMAALVLSLLIASAKSSYDMRSNQLLQLSAGIILLDRVFARSKGCFRSPEPRCARLLPNSASRPRQQVGEVRMRRSFLMLPAAVGFGLAIAAYFASSFWPGGAGVSADPAGMVWVPGGEFTMGSDDSKARADERPTHRVRVDGFWMDKTAVTNAEFRRFVEATGYVTVAERKPDWEELKKQLPPGTPKPSAEALVAGSGVFQPTKEPVDLTDWSEWWRWQPGADWRHPGGPDTSIEGKDDHPVVQVAWEDANAYAKWAGKRLPTVKGT